MKKNKKGFKTFKFKPLDFMVLFVLTAFVLTSLLITLMINPPKGELVRVFYNNEAIISKPLDVDETITLTKDKYPLLQGELQIEIKDGRVRIAKETSPQNICSKQGWTDNTFKSLICDPNKIVVKIVNDDAFTIPDDIPIGGIA